MGLVVFFAAVVVVVLVAAYLLDVKRRSSRDVPADWHTSHHPRKPREGSEFRHGPPGDMGGGVGGG